MRLCCGYVSAYSIKKLTELRRDHPHARINVGLGTEFGTVTVKGLSLL